MAATEIQHYPVSDSDNDSDNGKDELRHTDLEETIFKSYLQLNTTNSSSSQPDLSKIKSFLNSSRSGALSCMICLERIRLTDPTWSCYKECYAVFHLICIQSWARQASDLAAARAASLFKTLIPSKYLCYCGKTQDPDNDPWILPHSCGEVCERPLKYECGHYCLLLCHPGPCPAYVKRCGFKDFTCKSVCEKEIRLWVHRCNVICHQGLCPPCKAKGFINVNVGSLNKREFAWVCGKHVCERGCHEGKCGGCPYQGKAVVSLWEEGSEGMPCDAAVTCGSTCEKMLSCGIHRCRSRCHKGSCNETCRTVIIKSCGVWKLEETVQSRRDCGRHACRRRCCDGDCPPCSEICDRKLRCNNHKCPSPCHRGACAPCPLMVTISCSCGETRFERAKPPKCPKRCSISPLCRHAPNRKLAPCRLVCEEEYPCGHNFHVKIKEKKSNRKPECTPGTPCPPCPELVWRSCLGQHIGAEQMMVCSKVKAFSCQNLCGNLLGCTNHYCTKPCHALKSPTSMADQVRKLACPHPCPIPCHPGECSPCKTLIKRSCHCGAMVHLPNCSHLCPEKCHPGQCPSPEKCSKKVNVRCRCQNLKKEWLCQDVQAAYISTGCDPKDISKVSLGLSKVTDAEPKVPKRRKRRDQVQVLQEATQVSRLQKIIATARWFFICIFILVALVAAAYYGYKGLLWLSDWMNEVEERRPHKRFPNI
ncbi:hypothetical protein MKW92_010485 [Papaver armeniacum]|nr:hypothetical protein MKW92_010485 [Papaver armeniacum]